MNRRENMSLCEYAGVSDSTSERVMITGKKKGKLPFSELIFCVT